jgi:hypothetical protein
MQAFHVICHVSMCHVSVLCVMPHVSQCHVVCYVSVSGVVAIFGICHEKHVSCVVRCADIIRAEVSWFHGQAASWLRCVINHTIMVPVPQVMVMSLRLMSFYGSNGVMFRSHQAMIIIGTCHHSQRSRVM